MTAGLLHGDAPAGLRERAFLRDVLCYLAQL